MEVRALHAIIRIMPKELLDETTQSYEMLIDVALVEIQRRRSAR
jgi:hypothetical protein